MKNICQDSTHFQLEVVVVGNHEGLEEFVAVLASPLAPRPLSGWLHLFFWLGSIDALAH